MNKITTFARRIILSFIIGMEIIFKHEDNSKSGKFIIYQDSKPAGEICYIWESENKFIINHTEVYEDFNGKGYAKQLAIKCIEYARKMNVKIIPQCIYVKSLFDKNQDIRDVLYVEHF